MKKKLISAIALALALVVSLPPVARAEQPVAQSTSLATTASYASTTAFLRKLVANDISYDYRGVDKDGDDTVLIDDTCAGHNVTFRVWFDDDGQHAAYRIWDIITYNPSRKTDVIYACDELNRQYKYVSFYTENDNTVTMSYDLIFQKSDGIGESTMEALLRCYSILEGAYPTLEPFNN